MCFCCPAGTPECLGSGTGVSGKRNGGCPPWRSMLQRFRLRCAGCPRRRAGGPALAAAGGSPPRGGAGPPRHPAGAARPRPRRAAAPPPAVAARALHPQRWDSCSDQICITALHKVSCRLCQRESLVHLGRWSGRNGQVTGAVHAAAAPGADGE